MNQEIENYLNNHTFRAILPYFIEYIQNHIYISSKAFSKDFLSTNFNNFKGRESDNSYVAKVIRMFGKIAMEAKKLNILEKFSHRTYRVIDCREKKLTELENNLLRPKKSIPIVI